jgi:HK97 family phage major capsid protein
MNRLKHLLEERARIEGDVQAIATLCNAENRSRSTEEKTKYNTLKGQIEDMTDEIKFLEDQAAADQRTMKPVIKKNEPEQVDEEDDEKPVPSLRQQFINWRKRNRATIKAISNHEMRSLEPLELRVPANPMMISTVNAGNSIMLPNATGLGTVNDFHRAQPTFWNQLPKKSTNLNPLTWVNKFNKQGSADFIGEGVLKPLASFELQVQQSIAKKVAERMRVSLELLNDVTGMVSMIENELRYEVEKHANDQTITGTSSSTDPAGVTKLASLYTLTTVDVTTPNNFDAIRACVAQLRSLNFTGPFKAFINPIDGANMELSKGTDGHYLLPPFVAVDGTRIAGCDIIEDSGIPVGFVLVGDMRYYEIYMLENFTIRWGLDSDDFSKNLMTVIGEMRFHQVFSSANTGAFIYDSFANIKAAILAT